MARKLRLAFAVSVLALTLASGPAQADTRDPRPAVSRGFFSGLGSRLVALFTPSEFFDTFNEQGGEDPGREGDPLGRGYIDPNGTDTDLSKG